MTPIELLIVLFVIQSPIYIFLWFVYKRIKLYEAFCTSSVALFYITKFTYYVNNEFGDDIRITPSEDDIPKYKQRVLFYHNEFIRLNITPPTENPERLVTLTDILDAYTKYKKLYHRTRIHGMIRTVVESFSSYFGGNNNLNMVGNYDLVVDELTYSIYNGVMPNVQKITNTVMSEFLKEE